ncbi:MFS transporter [Streptomyces antnestii]|uniref:MFS transporter n=1 Tax=Streptomyces antnestii TaxID=2494256 RepID=A0A3S2XUD6_9ACTN|nr:MFS transporter [Streptomyces sp. San01]RVU23239.1 MFS transporter [Streptomyces sp. San01]
MSRTPDRSVSEERTPRRAALAAFLGSMVEYYDFFIYGSASALVFSHVFFPDTDPATATLASLATFAVAYIARPIGAFFVGHFGDRIGRKRVLVFCLTLMGMSTFAIGCLPSYGTAGVAAPVLLVVCRIAQGLSAAGEQSGASSMTLEHSPEGHRAFWTSFTLAGTQAGLVVATLAFLPVAALDEQAMYTWGWRVPFWASAIVVACAYWVRSRLTEPPEFAKLQQDEELVKLPVVLFVRNYWRAFLRIVVCHLFAVISTAVTVFGLSYATETWSVPKSRILIVIAVANVVAVAAIPMWARLADRVGRRPVFAIGAVGCALTVSGFFAAIVTQNIWLIGAATVLMSGVVYSAPNGIAPTMYAEMFDARVRYTGMAVSTQFANLALGFTPTIAAALMGTGTTGWVPLAALIACLCLLSAVAAFAGRETAHIPLESLGNPESARTSDAQTAPLPG